jgi:glycosyltransferase XagB
VTVQSKSRRPNRGTAQVILTVRQRVLAGVLGVAVVAGLAVDTRDAVVALIGMAMAFWVVFVGFRLALWVAAASHSYSTVPALSQRETHLPTYTVLVPLHREARMIPGLVKALSQLAYPQKKLQVLLLLEADDEETWAAVRKGTLPRHFKAVEVPAGGPKTKPNALNIGLALASGELIVVYDAEDRPESDQLLKAVAGFRTAPDSVVCLQARLAFWNSASSWVTRFYAAEYVTHFEWVLAGAERLGIVPPLGGTSNHFRTKCLRQVAIGQELLPFAADYIGGWDPYNVTEDAELAGALARHKYSVMMLDSVTWEEATAQLRHADKQRRRWLKGYAQTGLVYSRAPVATIREIGLKRWFFFNLMMLGAPISLLLSPLFWGATIVYFATRWHGIAEVFPAPLFYLGALLMLLGNLSLFYQLIAACLKRGAYGSVKYMLLTPFWWLFTSWSAYAMVVELVFRPHHWHKTQHGHDLVDEEPAALANAIP